MRPPKAFLILLALLATGCATEPSEPVSLRHWQKGLERYVWQQGDGDPTVLRDLSWDDVHQGFAILGEALPDRSTDIFGLLLAHRHIEGRPYFIFLVATVHGPRIEAVQPVALNVNAGRFQWSVGPADAQSLRTYDKWVRSIESAPNDPDEPIHFPSPSDTFQVSVVRDQVRITHDQTGATWKIDLARNVSASATRPTELDYRLERTGQVSGSRAS